MQIEGRGGPMQHLEVAFPEVLDVVVVGRDQLQDAEPRRRRQRHRVKIHVEADVHVVLQNQRVRAAGARVDGGPERVQVADGHDELPSGVFRPPTQRLHHDFVVRWRQRRGRRGRRAVVEHACPGDEGRRQVAGGLAVLLPAHFLRHHNVLDGHGADPLHVGVAVERQLPFHVPPPVRRPVQVDVEHVRLGVVGGGGRGHARVGGCRR